MNEKGFDSQCVALAVSTFYPNWYSGKLMSNKDSEKVRGDLALEFAKKAIEVGYRLVIVDSGSSKGFIEELQANQDIYLFEYKGSSRGESKRLAIDKASEIAGVQVIVLVEPEKVSFVTKCMQQTVEPILQGRADIVVPKRDEILFKSTYPRYMYESEVESNNIFNNTLWEAKIMPQTIAPFDWFFGPRAFRNNEHIVSLFKRIYKFSLPDTDTLYGPDEFSNILYFPVINALKDNLRVLNVEVPFSYPEIQKENEDVGAKVAFVEKRNMQRISILGELKYFLNVYC